MDPWSALCVWFYDPEKKLSRQKGKTRPLPQSVAGCLGLGKNLLAMLANKGITIKE
jgi:hypothetical protein